jgi:hypothetical protein
MSIFIKTGLWASKKLGYKGELNLTQLIEAIVPAPQINSDWDATEGVSEILNKPIIVNSPISTIGTSIYTNIPAAGTNLPTQNSIIFGTSAGQNASSANNSNFLGQYSGQNASGAFRSNFLGFNAGYGATLAKESNFLGTDAGREAIDARFSNFIGRESGYVASNAYQSNFVGNNSGYYSTNAFFSNFIGSGAGNSCTNADNSNFIGYSSGIFATNAHSSNFIGSFAGSNATTANNCNFLGKEAGMNSTGNNVNAFGYQANKGGTLSGQTVFSNTSLKSYLNRAVAVAAITVPLGAVAGNTYLYYNQTTFAIEAVRL